MIPHNMCMFVASGPTIQLKPGDYFNLTVINTLGAQNETHLMNTVHSPNSTNVHTHGLHIDPNIDSVYIEIGPGETYTYHYYIPANHAPGNLTCLLFTHFPSYLTYNHLHFLLPMKYK
jgi:FtsP/CotA-like multicopper oxidase with cupredoxin domain